MRSYFAVKWYRNRNNPEDEGRLLNDLPLGTKLDGWKYSQIFSDLDTIHSWGRLPSEFGLCDPEDDLTMMSAYSATMGKMQAYENYRLEKERKKIGKR